jgi:hypothetical protein|tara:strand:+ start:3736 stop:3981 length:246 start_codon:yes stop_codon:yes gene_type:complete
MRGIATIRGRHVLSMVVVVVPFYYGVISYEHARVKIFDTKKTQKKSIMWTEYGVLWTQFVVKTVSDTKGVVSFIFWNETPE